MRGKMRPPFGGRGCGHRTISKNAEIAACGRSKTMKPAEVRQSVREFRERNAFGGSDEHCFAPWFLTQAHSVSETRAIEQSSDGNYDFGIDAFNLDEEASPPSLVLVQAKLTESTALIAKGFSDLEKALPELAASLGSNPSEPSIQNKVLVNLRAALNRLSPGKKKSLRIEFVVIHLSVEDRVVRGNKFRAARDALREAQQDQVHGNVCIIREIGAGDLGDPGDVVPPPENTLLPLNGVHEFKADGSARMFVGVGRLSDLVALYKSRRDQLFSKNVRYYLASKKNTEKGPAGRMRETLKRICGSQPSISPEMFAFYHNGVTLFSRRAQLADQGINLVEPYVLNGCQTIKNAFFYRHDSRSKINDERWSRISISIRVIETSDDELVRTVTVNNNRQNSMSPAALRSNDPVQIRLETRFQERKIVYQRQEGAFDTLASGQPEAFTEDYENTRGTWIDIVDIARAIAAASGDVGLAQHPNDIFESDAAYERFFDEERRLGSLVFLTFLQNLHDNLGVILKRDLNLSPKYTGPKPTRVFYHTLCLFCRHLAKERDIEFVLNYGDRLYPKDRTFREEVAKRLRSQRSGIRNELSAQFMSLQSSDASEIQAAFERCESRLKLKNNVDPFDVFADLDSRTLSADEEDVA